MCKCVCIFIYVYVCINIYACVLSDVTYVIPSTPFLHTPHPILKLPILKLPIPKPKQNNKPGGNENLLCLWDASALDARPPRNSGSTSTTPGGGGQGESQSVLYVCAPSCVCPRGSTCVLLSLTARQTKPNTQPHTHIYTHHETKTMKPRPKPTRYTHPHNTYIHLHI